MKGPHEHTGSAQAELIADLEDEALSLQRKAAAMELEMHSLRRQLRRARRNPGYRIVNGIGRAIKPIGRLFGRNGAGRIQFARPAENGSASHPLSSEIKSLIRTLRAGVDSVYFASATQRNWALHQAFGHKPQWQLCHSAEQLNKAITSDFFVVPEQPLATTKAAPAFAHYELIVIDFDVPGMLWPLLQGRLWPHQKLLLHGKNISTPTPATRTGSDFAFYAAPPLQWLDPRHNYLPRFAPWKTPERRLTKTLPTGRSWSKISVVTPSFNQGRFIGQTFDSVLGQEYPNLEYLVLDGGSTDETGSILDLYRPRLAYSCSQKDNGQADAINKGFARTTGEILAWLNSDDQYAPDALMHVARAFDLFPDADLVVGGCGLLEGNTGVVSRIHHSALPIGKVVPLPLRQLLDLDNCWLKGHFFYQPEVFWRREIWEAAGGNVQDDLYYCFDYDLWVRMAEAGAKVVHIPDLLAIYRVHPQQKTYGHDLPYLPELKLVKSRREPSGTPNETLAKA